MLCPVQQSLPSSSERRWASNKRRPRSCSCLFLIEGGSTRVIRCYDLRHPFLTLPVSWMQFVSSCIGSWGLRRCSRLQSMEGYLKWWWGGGGGSIYATIGMSSQMLGWDLSVFQLLWVTRVLWVTPMTSMVPQDANCGINTLFSCWYPIWRSRYWFVFPKAKHTQQDYSEGMEQWRLRHNLHWL